MFHSIEGVWSSSQENTADVRELIPEFYFFPEMLQNMSGIDFGKRSNNEMVSNIRLPRWAKTP
jgi:Beige/BEACH domain